MKRDYSAVACIELRHAPSGARHHYVKYLKRFPLNTTYTNISAMLARIDTQLRAIAKGAGKEADITWAVDASGVGEGVCELIEQAMPLSDIYRVYITGGINATIAYQNRQVRLPKGQLVSRLLAAFDSDRIYISKRSKEMDAVLDELENFEIKVSDEGRDSYSAKIGSHDDLIIALGLSCWMASQVGEPVRIW